MSIRSTLRLVETFASEIAVLLIADSLTPNIMPAPATAPNLRSARRLNACLPISSTPLTSPRSSDLFAESIITPVKVGPGKTIRYQVPAHQRFPDDAEM